MSTPTFLDPSGTAQASARTVRRRAALALASLSLATFTWVVYEALPGGLMTVIAPDLHTSLGRVGLLVSGYAAVVVVASVPLARLTRRLPRRALLVGTLAVAAVATAAGALTAGFPVLVASRVVAALAHSVFWAVVFPTAAGLFPPERRGRAVARVAAGTSVAPVLGIPLALWVAQQAGWRAAFLGVACLGLVVATAVAVLLPERAAHAEEAERGSAPDVRAFVLLMVVTLLAVAGTMAVVAFMTPYLLQVSGISRGALSPVMVVTGAAGLVGNILAGRLIDRRPALTLGGALATGAAAFGFLAVAGSVAVVAIVALFLGGMAFLGFTAALQVFVMHYAPGGTDVASAMSSATFNLGTAAGSAGAAFLVDSVGVGTVPAAGAALVGAAALLVVVMTQVAGRARR